MNTNHRNSFCLLLACCSFSLSLFSNNAIYEQRRSDYINTALSNFGRDAITLQAYSGVPLDTIALNDLLNGISNGETSDFDIVKLIRILYFTNGTYDNRILPILNAVPYWVTKGDTVRNYWSENHMIMWMSSDWLLHEKYNKPIDVTLDARLRHYLRLKLQYGFYEFFSSVYAPYCLSGLINLADFAQDAEIKDLATQASQLLLKDLLLLTNDKGVFFPTAGRNYPSKYDTPYGQNHNNLIYLLTGMGPSPAGASHAGGFLASSTLPVDSVINSWQPYLDTTYFIGHTLDSGFVINSGMSQLDKVIFQWSSGAYFHPAVVQETAQLLQDSALWDQVDFAILRPLSGIPIQDFPATSNSLSCISKSSVICGEQVSIYKHNSVTLSSVEDFWKGKVGFQQHPCVANVGTTAVYTGSGEPKPGWSNRSANNANEHLPYVKQKSNIALLMYRPEPTPGFLGFSHKQVALHFNEADFDEIRSDSLWLLGRQLKNYVAVRRSCIGDINGVKACETSNGQTWVIMVGDSVLYGSFDNFEALIQQSHFEERWYYDSLNRQSVYYAKVVIDSISIEYAWGKDSSIVNSLENLKNYPSTIHIFPNPATEEINVDLNAFLNQSVKIYICNTLGQIVHTEEIFNLTDGRKRFSTHSWPEGIYLITLQTEQGLLTNKLVKQ